MTSEPTMQALPPDRLGRPASKATLIGCVILTGLLASAAVTMFIMAYWQEDLLRRTAEILAIAAFLLFPCRLAQMTLFSANRSEWPTAFERRLHLRLKLAAAEDTRLRTGIWMTVLAIANVGLHIWPLDVLKPELSPTLGLIWTASALFWLWILYRSPKSPFSSLAPRKP